MAKVSFLACGLMFVIKSIGGFPCPCTITKVKFFSGKAGNLIGA
jgi:hypothetical protein